MSSLSRARKRDFADVALRRREVEGILVDRRGEGWRDRERGEKKGRKGGRLRGTRAARDGGAERVS